MPSDSRSLLSRWLRKFACALRGVAVAVTEEDSFAVHVPAAIAVLCLGLAWGVGKLSFAMLVLCVAMVLGAELLNSAIERLSSAVTTEVHPAVRDALDMASGAVLVVSLGAAAVGVIVLFG
ncbi:MAG: diacylglycerol kinase [Lacipirellulaceae bacterium]